MIVSKKEELYKKSLDAKLVSFDIFGTLITRDVVDPNDIFKIAGADLHKGIDTVENKTHIEKLFEIDMSLVHPKNNMIDLLKKIRTDGKTVILTSDMYLNEQMIGTILEYVGIIAKNDYDRIFVSSEYGCTKKDGGLFKIIKEQYKVNYGDILHIGDALRSDYLVPTKLGISAIWVNEKKWRIHFHRSVEINTLSRFILNHTIGKGYEYSLGYRCYGPLMYGFCLWLAERIKDYKGQIYFLAREGYVIYKALDIMGFKRNNMHYMLVSRRGITGALLWTCNNVDEMVYSLRIEKSISLKKIASLLDISDCLEKEDNGEELQKMMFASADEILREPKAVGFISKCFRQIKDRSWIQYECMEQYFKTIEFDKPDNCTVIDIGWSGTMQHYLNKYLQIKKSNKKINGLYLGVRTNKYIGDAKEGFLFNGDSVKKQKEIFTFVGMLECILSEQHGSVKRYWKMDECDEPERCCYEFLGDDAKKIATIQDGILNFVKDMNLSPIKRILKFDSFLSSYNVIKYGNHPSKEDLDFYRNLTICDDSYGLNSDFGIKEWTIENIGNKLTNSIWKIAYLKCTFGRLFPAKGLYDFLYWIRRDR
ncbi:hypothetical protein [Butyrivibrio sp. FC2001]|uniref:hypothetical protein n=1 Tax=Butyrivibrio sp. FC2001 TaxID=1280671 RepID=UPI00040F6C4B|nr:hypothetical protein [Butyrivibrio sp. FC2001]